MSSDAGRRDSLLRRWRHACSRRVDGSSLALFRIAFGVTVVWEVLRYLGKDWIDRYWLAPRFHFTYRFFEWVQPWPGAGLYYHFVVMGLAALGMVVGVAYRWCAAVVFLCFTYVFLLEQAQYLNHFYLICLIALLLVCVPADRCHSLRERRGRTGQAGTVPVWCVRLLQFQIGVPYFFGGIAKLDPDWLRGEPMRAWLAQRTGFPMIGRFFDEEWAVYAFTYGGLLLDLLVVPLLLFRKTRIPAFLWAASFHLLNARLFDIGVFPWFMLAATTIFFAPDWPRRVVDDMRTSGNGRGTAAVVGLLLGSLIATLVHGRIALLPFFAGSLAGALVAWTIAARELPPGGRARPPAASALVPTRIVAGLAAWVVVQCTVPLRHLAIPGHVSWTEEGHRFSWRMKLRDKQGETLFVVTDPESGSPSQVDPREILTERQYRKMSTRPYLIHRFARHLSQLLEAEGRPGAVRARALAALNDRPWQTLIDPTVDLAAEPYGVAPAAWIVPLEPRSEGRAIRTGNTE